MLEKLHLKNVGPAPELEMEFAPRVNLITGDNGLGKSFLLDVAWFALTGRFLENLIPLKSVKGDPSISLQFLNKNGIHVTEETYGFDFKTQNWFNPGFYKVFKRKNLVKDLQNEPLDEADIGPISPDPVNRRKGTKTPCLVIYQRVSGFFAVMEPLREDG